MSPFVARRNPTGIVDATVPLRRDRSAARAEMFLTA
jgi:hypothetical protein